MLLWLIYITVIGLNLVAATLRRKLLSPPVRLASVLMVWTFLVELLRHFSDKQTSLILLHINIGVELVFHFAYFRLLLQRNKRPFLYGGLAFFIVALLATWYQQPAFFREKNYIDAVFLGICTSLWSGVFFYEMIHKPLRYSLKTDGNFWINCGNILFYPGTLLLFALTSYLEDLNPQLLVSLKPINYVLNLTIYPLYLIAMCLDRHQPQEAGSNPTGNTLS